MSRMKAINHSIVQRTLLGTSDLKVNEPLTLAKVGGDNFLDGLNILFLTKAIGTGAAKLSLSLGSSPETIVIDEFFDAPTLTAPIAVGSDPVGIDNIKSTLANGAKTSLRMYTMREVLRDILATKTTGHNLAKWHLNESEYHILMTLTAGTVPADTEMAVEAIIGM